MKHLNELEIELNAGEYPSFEKIEAFKTTLSHNGFSMTFDKNPNFKLFWDTYEHQKTFSFVDDMETIKTFLIDLLNKKENVFKLCPKIGISKMTMQKFLDTREIRDLALARILDYYHYKIYIVTDKGVIIEGKFMQCINDLNEIVRNQIKTNNFQTSKLSNINYSQIVMFNNGINLTISQLSKLIKFSIKI